MRKGRDSGASLPLPLTASSFNLEREASLALLSFPYISEITLRGSRARAFEHCAAALLILLAFFLRARWGVQLSRFLH